jgi:hypothetical protein
MPPQGSNSRRKSSSVNNRIESSGKMQVRSGLCFDESEEEEQVEIENLNAGD